jgi:tetratricopeptide (TPR) repeat protein
MAKWSSSADTGFLRTLEKAPAELPGELPQVGAIFEKTDFSAGLAGKIKEAAEKAKSRGKGSSNSLQVDELGNGAKGLRISGSPVGLTEDRLDKARKLIKESKFKEAIKVLDEVLAEKPDQSTALYLKGLCEFRLDKAEAALRIIAPLIRSTPLALDSQMRQLRIDIRERMLPDVTAQVFMHCLEGREDVGARRIQELLDLDPAVPVYHLLRIHVFLGANQVAQASAALDAATPYCQGSDLELLTALRQETLQRMLVAALEPARLQYRAMSWRKARKEMERVRTEWGHDPLWRCFNQYLEALGGGLLSRGRSPDEVQPLGEFRVVDRLHFLLVREELEGGKFLLSQARAPEAKELLLAGNKLTPYFPYLHYMIGQAAYLSILLMMAGRRRSSLDEVDILLRDACQYAESGTQDPEIKAAKSLVTAIQGAQQAIAQIRVEQKKQERDVAAMKPLGDQYLAVMRGVKDGLQSVEQFHDVRARLRRVRQEIPGTRRNLATDTGREALQQLSDALDANLQQLDDMEPEMEVAGQIVGFQQRLHDILDGIKSLGGLGGADKSLRDLKSDVETYQRRNQLPQDARKATDELCTAIERYRGELAEASLVNPFMERFDAAFSPLKNRRTPLQVMDAIQMVTSMTEIAKEGKLLLGKVHSAASRKAVQQVIDVANDIVGKIKF